MSKVDIRVAQGQAMIQTLNSTINTFTKNVNINVY